MPPTSRASPALRMRPIRRSGAVVRSMPTTKPGAGLWRSVCRSATPTSGPRTAIVAALQEALGFATQDAWTLAFSKAADPEQRQLSMLDEPGIVAASAHSPDHVLMLSGGADSLCAAAQSIACGRRPYLVGHRPSPTHDERQRRI